MVCKECKAPAVLYTCKKCGEDTCNKCHVDLIEERMGEKKRIQNGSDCLRCGASKSMALRTALTKTNRKTNSQLKGVLAAAALGKGQSKDQLEESLTVGITLAGTKKTVQQNVQKQSLLTALAQGGSKQK